MEQVEFSSSGRLLFARYAQGKCYVYDVTETKAGDVKTGPVNTAVVGQLHRDNFEKVADLSVHREGKCLAVGEERNTSEDTIAKIYWPKKPSKR